MPHMVVSLHTWPLTTNSTMVASLMEHRSRMPQAQQHRRRHHQSQLRPAMVPLLLHHPLLDHLRTAIML